MLQSWTAQEIKGLLAKGQKNGRSPCPRTKGLALAFKARGPVWVWQRRVDGTPRTIRLGQYPVMGIADARAKATEINEALANGEDVYVKFGAGQAPAPSKPVRGPKTCQEAWDLHMERSLNKQGTKSDKQGVWRRQWKDVMGDMLVTEVTYDLLMDVIEELRANGKGSAADTSIRYIKTFFAWCERYPTLTGLHDTPARKLKAEPYRRRTRRLDDVEVRWLWDAVGELEPVWRDYFLVVLLTGQRRSQIRLLERQEVTVEKRYIDFPPEKMKNNEQFLLPAGPLAWRLITSRLARHNSRFVFQSPKCFEEDRPIGGMSKAMAKLREKMEARASKVGITIKRWTIHDLRRTFSTGANSIRGEGENQLLDGRHIECALAHTVGGVEGVYNLYAYLPEKRSVMNAWELEVRRIVGEEAFEIY